MGKPWWDRAWLDREYTDRGRSASEIALAGGCCENNILYWLAKHNIPRRTMQQVRAKKHWGANGSSNPMYGKFGSSNPHWRGGVTPERQSVYSSREWASAIRLVWKRDPHKCRRCGVKNGPNEKLHLHHVRPFVDIAHRTDPTNLVLLCKKCHGWVHSKANAKAEFLAQKGGDG